MCQADIFNDGREILFICIQYIALYLACAGLYVPQGGWICRKIYVWSVFLTRGNILANCKADFTILADYNLMW